MNKEEKGMYTHPLQIQKSKKILYTKTFWRFHNDWT
jgi:hypothetical protein